MRDSAYNCGGVSEVFVAPCIVCVRNVIPVDLFFSATTEYNKESDYNV